MLSPKMTKKPTKFIPKFSLALLIVVINFASTNVLADEQFENKLTAICRDNVKFTSAYEETHRKCFVAGSKKMTWHEAKNACEQLPRIKHFGPPTLATIDLDRYWMASFTVHTMKLGKCDKMTEYYWTGAYIPSEHVVQPKNDNKWHWVADGSSLSAGNRVWRTFHPSHSTKEHCGAFQCWRSDTGIWQDNCYEKRPILCQYEADAREECSCSFPSVPKNAHLLIEKEINYQTSTLITVRCNDGYKIKGSKIRTEQAIRWRRGKWIQEPKECA